MSSFQLQAGDKAHDFDFNTPWATQQNFYESLGDKPAVLVFLRYYGCPVCQMEMDNLKREFELFAKKGTKVFVFLQSSPEIVAKATNEEAWPFSIVCDPGGEIFEKYAVEPGGFLKYLNPVGMFSAMKAIGKGYKHGKFEGKETQTPAAFAVNATKSINYAYYGANISDVPSPVAIAENIETTSPAE